MLQNEQRGKTFLLVRNSTTKFLIVNQVDAKVGVKYNSGRWVLGFGFCRTSQKELMMLVLSRKKGEAILIGKSIVLTVVEIRGDKIRIGIEAPRDVSIHRQEMIYLQKLKVSATSVHSITDFESKENHENQT